MNWKLIGLLSLSGLFMGVSTAFFIKSDIEIYVWIPIMLLIAFFIAKQATGKYFLHGFLVSLISACWILLAHSIFWDNFYELNKVSMDADFQSMPKMLSMKTVMLIATPIVGAFFGLIQGLMSFIASKLVKKE